MRERQSRMDKRDAWRSEAEKAQCFLHGPPTTKEGPSLAQKHIKVWAECSNLGLRLST